MATTSGAAVALHADAFRDDVKARRFPNEQESY